MTTKSKIVSLDEVRAGATEICLMCGREGISSISDLERYLGKSFTMGQARIDVDKRPSQKGTSALTISYIIPGKGIPVELRINSKLRYSLLIVKSQMELRGYNPDFYDPFGNLAQSKNIEFGWDSAMEELTRLSGK